MRTSLLLPAATVAALASAQYASPTYINAPVATNQPAGASYVATIPPLNKYGLSGTVSAKTSTDGKGVNFEVSVNGLPESGGPFMYHIHAKPVPADGNCTATAAHLDPYNRGEEPICDTNQKQQCQTGDLSGKYGEITTRSFTAAYNDPYSSTNPSDPAYFGNLSVVFHLKNKTRIACANFKAVTNGTNPIGTVSGIPTPSSNATLTFSASATGTGGQSGHVPTGPTGAPVAPSAPQGTGKAAALTAPLGFGAAILGLVAML